MRGVLAVLLCGAVWLASTANALRAGDAHEVTDVHELVGDMPWDSLTMPEWAKKLRQGFSDYSLFGIGDFQMSTNADFHATVNITDFQIRSPVNPTQNLPMIKVGQLYIDLDVEMAIATTLSRSLGLAANAPTIIHIPLIRIVGLEASLEEGNLEQFMETLHRYFPEEDPPPPPPPQPPPCKIKDPFSFFGDTPDARERVAHYVTKLTAIKDKTSSKDTAYRERQKGKLGWWVQEFYKKCDIGPNGEFDIKFQVVVGRIVLEGATIHKYFGSGGALKLGSLTLKNYNPNDAVDVTTIASLGSFIAASLGRTILANIR